jgi:hypothetical protein
MRATPPNAIVWLTAFLVIVFAGAALAILTWSKAEPTSTPWFWIRAIGLPALSGAFLVGLRLYYHEQEVDRIKAEDQVDEEDRAEIIRFAREPLAILGSAYVCAFDEIGVAKAVSDGKVLLEARRSSTKKTAIRHTSLTRLDQGLLQDRYRACFGHLLKQLGDKLATLPRRVNLDVYLQVPQNAAQQQLAQIWQDCWTGAGHSMIEAQHLTHEHGVMALNDWLDIRGGPKLEKFALFVAVQLHDIPPENSAEAAVGLLLGWVPLAERKGLTSLAHLHRPVQAEPDRINEAVSRALLWGGVEPAELSDLWQGGLEHADKSALTRAASDLALGVSDTDGLSGIHDIDIALGDAAVASAWLVLALAAEHASNTGKPQLVSSRQNTLRLAVVRPAGETDEAALHE